MDYTFIPHGFYNSYYTSEGMVSVEKIEEILAVVDGEECLIPYSRYGFSDLFGMELIPCIYNSVCSFSEGLVAVRKERSDKWGYIDKTGNESIKPKYDIACDFGDGLAVVGIGEVLTDYKKSACGYNHYYLNGKWGCIDKTGREIIPFGKYKLIGYYNSNAFHLGPQTFAYTDFTYDKKYYGGRVSVCDWKTEKFGFIDTQGNEIVPMIYDEVKRFSDGIARVYSGEENTGKWGFVDDSGSNVIPCMYDVVDNIKEGLALCTIYKERPFIETIHDGVVDNSKPPLHYYIDKKGNASFFVLFEEARSFSNGMAAVRRGKHRNGKWVFINKNGIEVISCRYDFLKDFCEGMAAVSVGVWPDDKYGFIDKYGNEIIPCVYDYADKFCEGVAAVRVGDRKEGYHGFVDINGDEIVQCKYSDARSFSEGLAAVSLKDSDNNEKWGFIDKKGFEVIPCIYDRVDCFYNGRAHVTIRHGKEPPFTLEKGYIKKTGIGSCEMS